MKSNIQLAMVLSPAISIMSPSFTYAQNEALTGTGEIVIATTGGSWEAAQKTAYYEPFTAATGIKVVLVPADQNQVLVSLERGDAPRVDILQLNAANAALFENKGALEPVDYQYFDEDTIAGMQEAYRGKSTVAQITYSLGIGYSEDAGANFPKNWVEFYDTDAVPGVRALPACNAGFLLDGAVLETALMGDGVPADELYPLDIDRAFRKLEEIRPHVGVFYTSSAAGPQALIDGRADFASTFNGRIFAVREQGAKVNFEWDQSLIQTQFWGVVKNSPNRENAMKFIAFASRAEGQAVAANLVGYGPTNQNAFADIKPELLPWLPGSPQNLPKQVLQNYDWWNTVDASGKSNFELALDRCNRFMAQ